MFKLNIQSTLHDFSRAGVNARTTRPWTFNITPGMFWQRSGRQPLGPAQHLQSAPSCRGSHRFSPAPICPSRLATTPWSRRERLSAKSLCELANHALGATIPTSVPDDPECNGPAHGWSSSARPSRRNVQERQVPSRDYQWRRDHGEIRRWREMRCLWPRM